MCKTVAHTVKMKEAPSLANSIPNARDKYSESKIQRFCVSVTSEIYKAPRQAKPSPRRAEYIGCGHGDESQVVGVSSFLYRTIKDLLPGNDFLLRDSKIINTRVISLSLFPPPPASFVDPECVSWDFGIQLPSCGSRRNRTTKGGWSTEGCAVLLSNDSHTVCQCKHLTDFAVLVTPFVPKDRSFDVKNANTHFPPWGVRCLGIENRLGKFPSEFPPHDALFQTRLDALDRKGARPEIKTHHRRS
ncbi:hypothetical protein Bbelb_400460 [Branchiostoma belcheri]|nr:hypothetical protein Bbelb_400460 [Branchiostoma belcheri]